MKNVLKKVVAMSAAVMMMVSVASMGASAKARNQFSVYISSTSKSKLTDSAATKEFVTKNGEFTLKLKLNTLAKGAGIKYWCYSDGSRVGSKSLKLTSLKTYEKTIKNRTYIRQNDEVLVTVELQPSRAGLGSQAGGTVALKK